MNTYAPAHRANVAERQLDIASSGSLLPLFCRWPQGQPPAGFVVFCHGLSASGRDYAALSAHWAAHGYLVIHPTFPDWIGAVARAEPQLWLDPAGDLSGWAANPEVRQRMYEILHDPAYWLARVKIVRAVMEVLNDVLAATCGRPAAPLPGAIAGHSFGAYTAQLFAGAEIDIPGKGPASFRDKRFAAAILLSAQGRDQQGLREGSWAGIAGPMLNVTGTRDGGAKGQDWHWKTEPYDFAPAGDKYLAVLEDGDHYLGGIARPAQSPMPAQRQAVEAMTLAFLDAHVASRESARTWLAGVSDTIDGCPLIFRRK